MKKNYEIEGNTVELAFSDKSKLECFINKNLVFTFNLKKDGVIKEISSSLLYNNARYGYGVDANSGFGIFDTKVPREWIKKQ